MTGIKPIDLTTAKPHGPAIIAGPCSAETRQQTLDTARQLASQGITVFRAGIWKPRTKPGGFEGVGLPGLQWLREVKELTGMRTATEVATAAHVKAAVENGVDMLWLGARTTANPFAVQEIADALKELDAPVAVMVKNPVNPDLELWIGAMQRLRNAGVERIAAVHRGFSAYGEHLYRNPPQWHIPIELRRRYPKLQIIHDPSHVAGRRELVPRLAQQALYMGFDALLIEAHVSPENALSDKSQQLTPADIGHLIDTLVVPTTCASNTENLEGLRQQIDTIDSELLDLLNRRMEVSRSIGRYKKEHRMPVFQVERHDSMMRARMEEARGLGMNPEFVHKVLSAIHEESVRTQINQKHEE